MLEIASCMSAKRLSYLRSSHCQSQTTNRDWKHPELCGVDGLFLEGDIMSPTVCVFWARWCFFFLALANLWRRNASRNMSNMIMCSLNLWVEERSLLSLPYIKSIHLLLFGEYPPQLTSSEQQSRQSASSLLFGIRASVFVLVSYADQSHWRSTLFFPLSLNLKCTVAQHGEPASYVYLCHVAFSSSSQQSRLIVVDSGCVGGSIH